MEFDHDDVRLVLNKDRLSNLPDELLHHILSCLDAKFSVQTCLLSSRWKLLWTSMPCLSFSTRHFPSLPKFARFVTRVLSRHVKVSSVKLIFHGAGSKFFVKMIEDYGLSQNLQELTVTRFPENHLYISPSLKRHNFSSHFFTPIITPLDFPALTTLHLSEIKFSRESLVLFSNCVNLKNLTLKSFDIMDTDELDISTPILSNLTLIDGKCSNLVINLIAPKLENLTIIDCSVINNLLNLPPGLSSLCYKGGFHPSWLSKYQFCSLNKVIISLSGCLNKEDDARKTIKTLQVLHTAKFLTLNSDIVECISSFPDLLSRLPSPFSKLICLNIVSDARKVKMSTQVRNFFLDNSSNATFIMESPKELPTKVREDEMSALVADIDGLMKEVDAPVELKDTLNKRLKTIEKKEVALENLIAEWTKKNKQMNLMMTEVAQTETFLEEMKNVFNQCFEDVGVLFSKTVEIKSMLEKLPTEMESSYSRQFNEAEIQCFLLLFCIFTLHSKVDKLELRLSDLAFQRLSM